MRNLVNRTPARFNLLAGDLCYAQAQGDIQPIINPDGPNGKPDTGNTLRRPPTAAAGTTTTRGSGRAGSRRSNRARPLCRGCSRWGTTSPRYFTSRVAADHVTVANYEPIGHGGHMKRLDFPGNGPSACPAVYSFRYGHVGVVSLDANDLSWEIRA